MEIEFLLGPLLAQSMTDFLLRDVTTAKISTIFTRNARKIQCVLGVDKDMILGDAQKMMVIINVLTVRWAVLKILIIWHLHSTVLHILRSRIN